MYGREGLWLQGFQVPQSDHRVYAPGLFIHTMNHNLTRFSNNFNFQLRGETSQEATVPEASPSTETSSMTRTLPRSMTRYCSKDRYCRKVFFLKQGCIGFDCRSYNLALTLFLPRWVSCQWPTLARTPTAPSSSSRWSSPPGWMEST